MDIGLDLPHAVPDDSDDALLMNFMILAVGMRRRRTMTSPPSTTRFAAPFLCTALSLKFTEKGGGATGPWMTESQQPGKIAFTR